MLLIPAIDIKAGRCVRLHQGQMDKETVYADDPLAMAQHWVDMGARRLHLVDLDGAVQGKPVNLDIIRAIVAAHPDLPVQIGGGIRDAVTIQSYLDAGVNYVIIGTHAVTRPDFVAEMCAIYPGHIIVGLDARDGKLATHGWVKLSAHDVYAVAESFQAIGVEAIIFTDISRDGMLSNVNISATVALAERVQIPVIASGGVHNLDDVRSLCAVENSGIIGAISGRALYEGTLDLVAAQALADSCSMTP